MKKFQLVRNGAAIATGIQYDDGRCELEFLGGFPSGKRNYASLQDLLDANCDRSGLTQMIEA